MIATWVYIMDATMTMTGDLKNMSVGDANVQTTDMENAVSRINRDEYDRQSQRATFGVVYRPNGTSHSCDGMFGEHIKWPGIVEPNVNVNKALEVGRGRLNQFEASYPDSYFDVCISCYLASCLTNKRNC